MREFWRNLVNFFVEALSEEPALVPIRSMAHLQMERRLQQLRRR